jgi:hypothetical protein
MRLLLVALLLGGCSAEAIRQGNKLDLAPMPRDAERQSIRERGIEFCKTYPDDVACKKTATDLAKYCRDNPRDSACQGPNSK